MNILFISNLEGCPWAGPVYSVPKQIEAQSKFDNVFWYNISNQNKTQIVVNLEKTNWKRYPFYHDTKEFPSINLYKLPMPFNKPDLIVFEQFYKFSRNLSLLNLIMKTKIPYVIIPRGELTHQAQKQKFLKKKIANWLFFYRFTQYAASIQYLTKQEQLDSGNKWNKNSFIIPNGVSLPEFNYKTFNKNKIKIVYIGRIDKYHKGLDLLIEACNEIQSLLRKFKFIIELYGHDNSNNISSLSIIIKEYNLADIICFRSAVFAEEKAEVLQQADAFIMTSRFEGHPMGLIEALAYGLPCLVTTGTNMREEIESFDAGWGADTTAESIAEALKKMIFERNILEEKSKNARKLASQYDWSIIAKKSHDIYERILGKEE